MLTVVQFFFMDNILNGASLNEYQSTNMVIHTKEQYFTSTLFYIQNICCF